MMEGFDGSEIQVIERPIPGTKRTDNHSMRCRPGTFEWRYARGQKGSELELLYLAGTEFNRLWERAGMDGPGTVDWSKSGSTQWRGLPDNRTDALSEIRILTRELGKMVTARLVNYVVQGMTSRQVANHYNQPERDMAIVLASDLHAAAGYFRLEN